MTEPGEDGATRHPADRGEPLVSMEPERLYVDVDARQRGALVDLALELAEASAALRHRLPDPIVASLAALVRATDCYYSNLIEGHDTHPLDIEHDLQLEAAAHIAVQQWIDDGGLDAERAVTVAGVRDIHRSFYEHLPDSLRVMENPDTGARLEVVPGQLRKTEVRVGRHVPVSPGAVPRFLARFEEVFTGLGKAETIIAAAAMHHRLTWIHPFADGNGRVARLMSHAVLRSALDTGSLWSVSRGLARSATEYRQHLANCDLPRRHDLDGRGRPSEEALTDFTRWFLETCLDQVRFMEQLIGPGRLRERILRWAENETAAGRLRGGSARILEALLYRGALLRGEVPSLLGVSERQGRRVVAGLVDAEVVVSEATRAPLRLAFPAGLAHEWIPGLIPMRSK